MENKDSILSGDIFYKCSSTNVKRYVVDDIRKTGGVTSICYLKDNLGNETTVDDFTLIHEYSDTKEEAIRKQIESLTYKIDIQNNELTIMNNDKIILEGMLDDK